MYVDGVIDSDESCRRKTWSAVWINMYKVGCGGMWVLAWSSDDGSREGSVNMCRNDKQDNSAQR